MLLSSVPRISLLDSQSKFHMLTLFPGRHIGVLGSEKFCETFRPISKVWENAQTYNLEKCLLSLFPITSQLLDFIHWMVFDLLFYCVTVKTIY